MSNTCIETKTVLMNGTIRSESTGATCCLTGVEPEGHLVTLGIITQIYDKAGVQYLARSLLDIADHMAVPTTEEEESEDA